MAVFGCGLEYTYPPESGSLRRQIEEQGAVISEFPMSTKPDRNNFPARNRVISDCPMEPWWWKREKKAAP